MTLRTTCFAIGAIVLGILPAPAQTYVSAEPIPSDQIVGPANLTLIESIGYSNLTLWSQRLLNDCHIVQNVIDALAQNNAVTTVRSGNTVYLTAAGGFQAVTDPTYVLTVADFGSGAASATDIFVLDNALGYVLNQGGTAQFSPVFDKKNPYEFALAYAVVTYAGTLNGEQAKAFFDYLGTIDPKLWSGTDAGFTQITFGSNPVANYLSDNSMLFLIGAVPKHEFEQGLYTAAVTTPNMSYYPLNNGNPSTATAGAAFPGNDWITYPNGDQYLVNIPNLSPHLMSELASLRQQHLTAVANLITAIQKGNVALYLKDQFKCPN